MSLWKPCLTDGCNNSFEDLPRVDGAKSRRRYCDACKITRRASSISNHKENVRNGTVRLSSGATARQRAAQLWLCEHLQDHPCIDCGETNIIVLQFNQRDPAVKPRYVSELVARGAALEDVQAAVAACVVRCANCEVIHKARAAQGYRLQYLLDRRAGRTPFASISIGTGLTLAERVKATFEAKLLRANRRAEALAYRREPVRRTVPPAVPQPAELGGAAIYESQIARAGASDLPPHDVHGQAPPQQAAHGGTQEDVRHVPAAVGLGDPVGEATGGGWPDDPVDTGDEPRVQTRLLNPGVVVNGRFVRPERKR